MPLAGGAAARTMKLCIMASSAATVGRICRQWFACSDMAPRSSNGRSPGVFAHHFHCNGGHPRRVAQHASCGSTQERALSTRHPTEPPYVYSHLQVQRRTLLSVVLYNIVRSSIEYSIAWAPPGPITHVLTYFQAPRCFYGFWYLLTSRQMYHRY